MPNLKAPQHRFRLDICLLEHINSAKFKQAKGYILFESMKAILTPLCSLSVW